MPQNQRHGATEPEPEPVLLVSRSDMDQAIAERLDKGQELLERRRTAELYAAPETGIPRLRNDFNTWDEYNEQLLRSRFSHR